MSDKITGYSENKQCTAILRQTKRNILDRTDTMIILGKPEQRRVLPATPKVPYDLSYAVQTASYGTGHAKVRLGCPLLLFTVSLLVLLLEMDLNQ
jgi:hypothetical protein